MTVTALDAKAALIIVDLQARTLSSPTVHPMTQIVANAGRLAPAFRTASLPVVLVNVGGVSPGRTDRQPRGSHTFSTDDLQFAPALGRAPSDHVVTKRNWGAFSGTGLSDFLRSRCDAGCPGRGGNQHRGRINCPAGT